MPCPHCISADKLFDPRVARRELAKLHRRGPSASTRKLIDALPRGSLLDIGGGVGAIQHAFAPSTDRITHVDASKAYIAVAKEELERLGFTTSDHRFGDFVAIEAEITEHEVVTLDRVLCCYPDLAALVATSTSKASRAWGVVFPKERWWSRAGASVMNFALRIKGSDYQAYVHPEAQIQSLAEAAGLRLTSTSSTWLWNVWAFTRLA
ncbi:MAG: 2-polyprenyl-3-methyl-5-hydroxy-6-metoxy-1,4-benzoquinol methylase [Myxococcota bacterium]|jgi:2-polyprenyl-3-methyl-5-hydroxy-6-metoxy-1,4-benzoquinol methylase